MTEITDSSLSKNAGTGLFTRFIIISIFLITLSAYTRFIFAKDYSFYIEAACDPSSEICFLRDCEEYCPPNELEHYKAFTIPAAAFEQCSDNSCSNICEEGSVCERIECGASEEDVCTE
ncbi:MAG: hypothetical protein AAB618_01945 [Patescibacteria group bacterium]